MIWTCLATFFKARRSQYAPIVLALLGFVWAMLAFEITVEFISESCLTVLAGTVMGLIVVVKREVDREVATRYETERDQLAAGPADEDVYWGDGQTSAASDWPGHSM
jgi:NADH:ubiquinone oxidoreductase subunit 6 (subunit J)